MTEAAAPTESEISSSDSSSSNATTPPHTIIEMETVAPSKPREASMQVYFNHEKDKYIHNKKKQNPVSIRSSSGFEVSIDPSSVLPGWYWAIFCVSLKDIPVGVLHNMVIHVRSDGTNEDNDKKATAAGEKKVADKKEADTTDNKGANTRGRKKTDIMNHKFFTFKAHTCKTVVSEEEIVGILGTESARLRLHRQVEVIPKSKMTISIEINTVDEHKEDASFDLHYFELACADLKSQDYVLWGDGRPDQFIRIGANDAKREKRPVANGANATQDQVISDGAKDGACEKWPVAIDAYDISDSGKLAVTVYFTDESTPPNSKAAASTAGCASIPHDAPTSSGVFGVDLKDPAAGAGAVVATWSDAPPPVARTDYTASGVLSVPPTPTAGADLIVPDITAAPAPVIHAAPAPVEPAPVVIADLTSIGVPGAQTTLATLVAPAAPSPGVLGTPTDDAGLRLFAALGSAFTAIASGVSSAADYFGIAAAFADLGAPAADASYTSSPSPSPLSPASPDMVVAGAASTLGGAPAIIPGVKRTRHEAVFKVQDLGGTIKNAFADNPQSNTRLLPTSSLRAHIDVWDLSAPSEYAPADGPQAITRLLASGTFLVHAFKAFSGDLRGDVKPTINISSTGSQIVMAMGCVETLKHATPLLIFREDSISNPSRPNDLAQSTKPSLEDRDPESPEGDAELQRYPEQSQGYSNPRKHYRTIDKPCKDIQLYFGFGSFHNSDQDDHKPENERYFNIHGSKLDVYSTNGEWKQLYSLSFGINKAPSRQDDMVYLRQSLRGRYFAWTGDVGAVSVWDFETGKSVTTILIPKDAEGVGAALSENGSMIAISAKGSVRVHDVASGIQLRVRPVQWKKGTAGLEMIFKESYLMALNAEKSTRGSEHVNARSIFRARNLTIVDTRIVYWQYRLKFSSTSDPVFAYRQGAILNIKRLGSILSPTGINGCGQDCVYEPRGPIVDCYGTSWHGKYQSNAGTAFDVQTDYEAEVNIRKLTIISGNNRAQLSLGPALESQQYCGFFVAASSRLVLILNGFLQVWRLTSNPSQVCELLHVEAFVDVPKAHADDICITEAVSVQFCKHGRRFTAEINPIRWLPAKKVKEIKDDSDDDDDENDEAKDGSDDDSEAKGDSNDEEAKDDLDEKELKDVPYNKEAKVDPGDKKVEQDFNSNKPPTLTLTFPRTADDTFLTTKKYRYEKGIASLIDTYANSGLNIKEAVIRFLVKHIRPSVTQPISSLVFLCRSWRHDTSETFNKVLADLLPQNEITWIPDTKATKVEDPLSILLRRVEAQSSVLEACKTIMDYCEYHAVESKNLSFLSPFLRNLKDIMNHFPRETREYLDRMASISVNDSWRDYIIENSIVAHSPWQYIQFWKAPVGLDKIKDQVMQLHEATERQSDSARWRDYFIEKLVAFSLWQYRHLKRTTLSLDKIKDLAMQLERRHTRADTFTRPIYVAAFDALWHFKEIGDCNEDGSKEATVKLKSMVKHGSTNIQGLTVKQQGMMKGVLSMEEKRKREAPKKPNPAVKRPAMTGQDGVRNQGVTKTTWWRVLYHMFRLKFYLKTHTYVERHEFSLEFFDNPAIDALVAYKW
ncbi:hypothetical protein BGZ72_005195 [Mortierella alpina]|nr:hypothetical protein BGZ72_005195 [Mortierella alpina]